MSRASGDRTVFASYGTGRRKVIAFGVPTLGRVSMRFLHAHYNLAVPTNASIVHIYVEGKEVGDARNEIVARALAMDDDERNVTHVFFLDDDVLPHPDAFKQLLSHDRDIVGGLYFLKSQTPTAMILMDDGEGVAKRWTPGDLVECSAHGMGLTLVRTEVFTRLRDETDLGLDAHGFPCWFKTQKDRRLVRPDGVTAIVNETEDVYFLRRARALGYQPCVDTGPQAFGFHWEQSQQRAFPLAQWFEHLRHQRITWTDTPDGRPVVWEGAA